LTKADAIRYAGSRPMIPGTPFFMKCAHSAVAALLGMLVSAEAQLVINEIHYRPGSGYPEKTGLEFVELHNPGNDPVFVGGWSFTSGIRYVFPAGAVIPPDGYAVVAADPAAVAAQWGITGVLGPWAADSGLANNGERIRLSRPGAAAGSEVTVAEVSYATEGDWGDRIIESAYNGWSWSSAGDTGVSIELMNPGLAATGSGQNWRPCQASAGATPGRVNSVRTAVVAPIISAVRHEPGVPAPSQAVTVRCSVASLGTVSAVLHWRNATGTTAQGFTAVPMLPDGNGGFRATVPGQPDKAVVEFYVAASDANGTRTWPATAAGSQQANAHFLVDREVPGTADSFYRLVLTGADNAAFESLASSNPGSDRQFNATLIASQAGNHTVRYRSSMRIRGNSSRNYQFKPLRISMPNDAPWDGITDFNLNPKYPWLQFIGMKMFRAAGLASFDVLPVELRRNGVEQTSSGSSAQDYGKWVRMEELSGSMADRQWPSASSGNLYKKGRPDEFWRATQPPPATPDGLLDGWSKQNNGAANDWSDLTGFFLAWQRAIAPYFTGETLNDADTGTWTGNSMTDEEIEYLGAVADTQQWARWFAMMTILQSNETNISNGQDDDYAAYFRPEGATARRMTLLPHDLDTILGRGDSPLGATARGLYDMTAESSVFKPLLPLIGNSTTTGNAGFRVFYHNTIRQILGSTLNADPASGSVPTAHAFIDNHLSGWVPESVRTDLKSFMTARQAHLLSLIGSPALPPGTPTAAGSLTRALSGVVLNEILASNASAHAAGGGFPDIIEIRNGGPTAVDLGGMTLTDDLASATRFTFPGGTVLPAGGIVVVHAGGDDAVQGFEAGFALDEGGETLYFHDSFGALRDSLTFGPQVRDLSLSRTGANGSVWALTAPTVGLPNGAALPLGLPQDLRINEWLAAPGFRFPEEFVEIFNPGTRPVPMGGLRLTDDFINDPARHVMPALSFAGPASFVVFRPAGNSANPARATDLPFRLDADFGWLAISGQNGVLIDRIDLMGQAPDTSVGRSPDGGSAWAVQTLGTPGNSNLAPPAAVQALLDGLRITEILYRPAGGSDSEFVELRNVSAGTLDLSGVRFSEGINYEFPAGVQLAAGRFLVVCRNREMFAALWPAATSVLAPGQFTGALDNSGETISLTLPAPWRANILSFRYEPAWEPLAATAGHSLMTVDAATTSARDWSLQETWTVSSQPGGSPGSAGPPVITSPLTAATVTGDAFTYQITATRSPTSYGASGLPPGWTIDRQSGLISGTAGAAGTWTMDIWAANEGGSDQKPLTLTVAASGPLASLQWDHVPTAASAGFPFAVRLTARDAKGRLVLENAGPVTLSATVPGTTASTIVFSEMSEQNPDRFEITNVSNRVIDTAGWRVFVGHNNQPITQYFNVQWNLPASLSPGQTILVLDTASSSLPGVFFGGDFLWATNSRGWALMVDAANRPVDFMIWAHSEADMDTGTITIGTNPIPVRSLWKGPALPALNNRAARRNGSADRDDISDWEIIAPADGTWGILNPTLSVPWASAEPLALSPSTVSLSQGEFCGWLTIGSPGNAELTATMGGRSTRSTTVALATLPLDSDGDGMPDGWESNYGTNPFLPDSQADPDGDGLRNSDEFHGSTLPLDRNSGRFALSADRLPDGRLGFSMNGQQGIPYRLMWTDGSQPWAPLPGGSILPSGPPPHSLTTQPPQGSDSRAFFRTELILPK